MSTGDQVGRQAASRKSVQEAGTGTAAGHARRAQKRRRLQRRSALPQPAADRDGVELGLGTRRMKAVAVAAESSMPFVGKWSLQPAAG